jgi:hypothetical protein
LVLRVGEFEFEFAFLGAEHDRLAFHASDHIERSAGLSAQGHLQDIVGNAGLNGFAQLALHFKEAIRRAESFNTLMRPLVIIVFDPATDAFPRRIEALELGAGEELLPNRGPEALDFAQGHRVLGP